MASFHGEWILIMKLDNSYRDRKELQISFRKKLKVLVGRCFSLIISVMLASTQTGAEERPRQSAGKA